MTKSYRASLRKVVGVTYVHKRSLGVTVSSCADLSRGDVSVDTTDELPCMVSIISWRNDTQNGPVFTIAAVLAAHLEAVYRKVGHGNIPGNGNLVCK